MGVVVSMVACPNCGAPHSLAADRRILLCIYCNTSMRVDRAPGAAGTQLTAHPVSKEDVERIKQLLVDAKRGEAVALYARAASVPQEEAERAIDDVVVSSYFTVTGQLPLNAIGFSLYALLIVGGLGVAAFGATRAADSAVWWVLVALGLAFAAFRFAGFVPHFKSTLVASFGATGRARVVRRSLLRASEKTDGYLLAVVFEVIPDDGSPPFVDQENLYVGGASLAKLVPGNVVRARYDRVTKRVFPCTPVTVLGTA